MTRQREEKGIDQDVPKKEKSAERQHARKTGEVRLTKNIVLRVSTAKEEVVVTSSTRFLASSALQMLQEKHMSNVKGLSIHRLAYEESIYQCKRREKRVRSEREKWEDVEVF